MAASGRDSCPTLALDLFCGTGSNSIHLCKYFDEVLAADINARRVEYAKFNNRFRGASGNIVVHQNDFFNVYNDFSVSDLLHFVKYPRHCI